MKLERVSDCSDGLFGNKMSIIRLTPSLLRNFDASDACVYRSRGSLFRFSEQLNGARAIPI